MKALQKVSVVGNTGKITPSVANPTHNQPAIINNIRFMLCFSNSCCIKLFYRVK